VSLGVWCRCSGLAEIRGTPFSGKPAAFAPELRFARRSRSKICSAPKKFPEIHLARFFD